MITTAASEPASRSCRNVSRPSIPGSQTSSRIQPYARRPSALRHSSPVATVSVTKPSSSITARSVSRMPRSSSTIRIESMDPVNRIYKIDQDLHVNPEKSCKSCLKYRLPRRFSREFDHKTRAARVVSFGADVSTMLEYYSLHDREAETGAA